MSVADYEAQYQADQEIFAKEDEAEDEDETEAYDDNSGGWGSSAPEPEPAVSGGWGGDWNSTSGGASSGSDEW